jgi:hypothetical protein
MGKIEVIYVRDPDSNVVELASGSMAGIVEQTKLAY